MKVHVHDIMHTNQSECSVYTSACMEHVKNAFNTSVCVQTCAIMKPLSLCLHISRSCDFTILLSRAQGV